jgi:hypothetical protein
MNLIGPLTLSAREHAIRAVLEARFSVGAFEAVQRDSAARWASPRNEMARGIYGEAMREKQRLAQVTDQELVAEAVAIGFTGLVAPDEDRHGA